MGGVENVEKIFHPCLAALSRIEQKEREGKEGIVLDLRTCHCHKQKPRARKQNVNCVSVK